MENAYDQAAQDLSRPEVPVAVVDRRTLQSLKRLGATSPIAQARSLFEPAEPEAKAENPLLKAAQQKFNSAEVRFQQQCTTGVMDLLVSALLLKVAGLHGQSQAPTPETAAVWLYSEIVPGRVLTPEQAGILVRIISLRQAQEVPERLIEQSLVDVRGLFSSLSGIFSDGDSAPLT